MRSLTGHRAFTTVELMVGLVVGGIVAAGVATVLRRQQRFFTNASMMVEQRFSLRDATGILPGEVRALAPGSGDVLAFSDSSLDMRATIGAGIVCDTLAGAAGVALAPSPSNGRAVLSSLTTTPQAGDIALVFDARVPERAVDDAWIAFDVASVAWSTVACSRSPLTDPPGPGALRMVLRFPPSAVVPQTVTSGAFVRVLRRVRYRFYRAGTGEWYLGYAEWDGVGFGIVQPVSGPFASYSRRQGSGLELRYFDDAGTQLFAPGDAARIARVDVVVRGAAREALNGSRAQLTDSQSVTVRVRNR